MPTAPSAKPPWAMLWAAELFEASWAKNATAQDENLRVLEPVFGVFFLIVFLFFYIIVFCLVFWCLVFCLCILFTVAVGVLFFSCECFFFDCFGSVLMCFI